jgi:fructose-1,6-bisphosphatase/inositol monophosphatase family enzyme
MLHSALLNVMIAAARKAARALKRDFGELEKLQVSIKGPANFVSAADRRAEETLFVELMKARPGYSFLGEEGGRREGADKTHTWIVDPLDGTTNFLHGIPQFAISIALERDGTVVAGLIYNPANEEMFIAERGKGAFLNEQRIAWRPQGLRMRSWRGSFTTAAATFHPRKETGAIQERLPPGGSAPPRSISPGSRPAVSTATGNAISSRGTWRPG